MADLDTALQTEDDTIPSNPFEGEMVERVKKDFNEAEQWLRPLHRFCVQAFEGYHNARTYEDLRKKNKFPVPVIQTLVDQYVAHVTDKLFYANRPCTVVGVEEDDKADAEVKQEMIAFQDRKDGMTTKLVKAIRDSALYPYTVAQVNYVEKIQKKWQQVPVQQPIEQGLMDRLRGAPQQFTTTMEWQHVPTVVYQGPEVKRVDPTDCFFGPDKTEIGDDFPIMIRTKQAKSFFKSQDYFFNQDQIKDIPAGPVSDRMEEDVMKRDFLNVSPTSANSLKMHEYIEWQGYVDAAKLYEYLEQDVEGLEPDEEAFVICGVVDGITVVRLQEDPLQLGRPNVIVGWAMPEEDEFFGGSMTDRVMAVHLGSQSAMGMLLENLKQSVNAMWIINTSKLKKGNPLVNKAGHILETNDDVNNVAKRVEQPAVARDLYLLIGMLQQMGQDTANMQDTIQGKSEPGSETLGETTILANQAELGLRNSLRCFEATFIEPLYELRNEINANFLDKEYVFNVIGDGVVNWRSIQPEQIRARVDFVSESSTREANKAVMGQQLLQLMELAPLAAGMGQPVRADLMMQKWLQVMGSMREAETLQFFPLVQMEKLQGIDANQLMVEMAMAKQQNELAAAAPQPIAGEQGPPGERPQPTSEAGAVESANAQNQTDVGVVQ